MPRQKYQPTDSDREIVLHMAAIPNVSHENIAFVIRNPKTGKPVNVKTLERYYSHELKIGMAVMQRLSMKSFAAMIEGLNWPAVRLGLHNYCGLRDGGEVVAAVAEANNNLNITFRGSEFVDEPMPPPPEDLEQSRSTRPPGAPVIPLRRKEPPLEAGPERPRYGGDVPEPARPPRDAGQPLGPANSMLLPPPQGPRTELDVPGNEDALPWHKRKITGQIRRGPLQWGGKSTKNSWMK